MSRDNTEIVREALDAYNRGDLDAVIATVDQDVEFVTLLLGTHRGRDAIRVLYEQNRETLAGYSLDPEEITEIGPERVLAVVRQRGSGSTSRIALGDTIAFLVTLEDGRVVRQESFRNKQEALEAARG
jgi:ketosteroid isomerase-like protein